MSFEAQKLLRLLVLLSMLRVTVTPSRTVASLVLPGVSVRSNRPSTFRSMPNEPTLPL